MPDTFVFADEAGCFTFNREPNVSRYFILCTVLMDDCSISSDLLSLRRALAWEGAELGDYFHASSDKQAVRDRVFAVLAGKVFSVQATIMEKAKAQPHIRETKTIFYQYAWYYHYRYGISPLLTTGSETLVTTASLGVKREKVAFQKAVADVMRQTSRHSLWRADFLPAQADPCLQVADYCAWAIMRKWERQDSRSYDLIRDRITYERDMWAHGNRLYY